MQQIYPLEKMNFSKKFVFCLSALFIVHSSFAATYTAVASGNWSADATWSGTGIPGSGDAVVIENGKTITVNIANAACSSMDLGTGGLFDASCTLTFNTGSQLTVGGAVQVGSLIPAGHIDMSNGGTFISSSWSVTNGSFIYGTGTVKFSGSFTLPNNTNFDQYYHLEIISGTTKLSRTTTVQANLSLSGTGVLDVEGQSLTVRGNWTQSGTGSFTEETETVTLDGAGDQYINHTGTETFYNIVVNKATGSLIVNTGSLSISNLLTINNGIVDLQTNTLNGAGGLTMNNGDLQIGQLSSVCGCTLPALTGTYNITGGTVTFKGAGPQTIRSETVSTPVVPNYNILVLKGSGTKSLDGNLDVDGSLYLSETAELDASTSNRNMTIAGNWINTSSYSSPDAFNERNGKVTFDGAGAISLTSSSIAAGETFYDLTMSKSAAGNDLTMNNHITITHQLTLTLGRIITSAKDFTIGSNAIAVSGGNDNSFVDGAITKNTTATTSYVLPVGKINPNAEYRWIEITPSGNTPTTYVAEYFYNTPNNNTDVGSGVNRVSDLEKWTLLRTSGTEDVKVELSWNTNSVVNTNITDVLVVQDDGTAGPRWINQCACTTTGTTASGSIQTTGYVTLFGASNPLTLASPHATNNELGNSRYSVADGNWNSTATWATRTGGPSGASIPTSTKRVIIEGGKRIDVDVATANALKLTIGNNGGGTLDFNATTNDLAVAAEGVVINSIGDVEGTNVGAELRTSGDIMLNADVSAESGGGASNFTVSRVTTGDKTFSGTGTLMNFTNSATTTLTGNITIKQNFGGFSTLTNAGTVALKGTTAQISGSLNLTTYANTIEFDNTIANFDFSSIATTYSNLTLSGASTKRPLAAWTVNGNFTLNSGVTLDQDSFDDDITVKGNWTNLGGTFTPSTTSTTEVTLSGTAEQNVTSGPSAFGNLIINNTSATGVVLQDDMSIGSGRKITLTDGYVFLGNHMLTLVSGNVNPGTPSTSSFIVTNGKGSFAIEAMTGSRIFPVGSSGAAAEYTPVTVDNTGGTSDRYDVKVCDNVYSDGNCSGGTLISSRTINKTWNISESVAGGSSVDLTLQWNAAHELTSFDRTGCFISHYTGGSWVQQQSVGGATGSGPYVRTVTNLTGSFSPFGVGSAGSPLPIQLLHFDAQRNGDSVLISWTTASEKNNDYFLIEKTTDGITYTTIAKIKGAGDSDGKLHYSTIDNSPSAGVSYYRLKQVDFDGKYWLSGMEEVIFDRGDHEFIFSLYPNPTSDEAFIQFHNVEKGQQVALIVYDLVGKIISSQTVFIDKDNEHTIHVDFTGHPSGMYIVAAHSNNINYQKKLIVKSLY